MKRTDIWKILDLIYEKSPDYHFWVDLKGNIFIHHFAEDFLLGNIDDYKSKSLEKTANEIFAIGEKKTKEKDKEFEQKIKENKKEEKTNA